MIESSADMLARTRARRGDVVLLPFPGGVIERYHYGRRLKIYESAERARTLHSRCEAYAMFLAALAIVGNHNEL
jgi:hypothetical protein